LNIVLLNYKVLLLLGWDPTLVFHT